MGNLALAIANAIVDYDFGAVSTMDELYQQLDRDINHIEVKVIVKISLSLFLLMAKTVIVVWILLLRVSNTI